MENIQKPWSELKVVRRKRLKRRPEQFCLAIKEWFEAGAYGEVRAALLSALTSAPEHSVNIAKIRRQLGWSIEDLALVAARTEVPVSQIERSCSDECREEFLTAMRAVAVCEKTPVSKRREDKHPYVLTRGFRLYARG